MIDLGGLDLDYILLICVIVLGGLDLDHRTVRCNECIVQDVYCLCYRLICPIDMFLLDVPWMFHNAPLAAHWMFHGCSIYSMVLTTPVMVEYVFCYCVYLTGR